MGRLLRGWRFGGWEYIEGRNRSFYRLGRLRDGEFGLFDRLGKSGVGG